MLFPCGSQEDIEISQQVVLQVLAGIAEVSGYNQVSHKFNPVKPTSNIYSPIG